MKLKTVLSIAFVAALLISGSVSAEEVSKKETTMNAAETTTEESLKGDLKSNLEKQNTRQEKSVTKASTPEVKKPTLKKVVKPNSTHTVKSKSKARSELSPTDQAQLDANAKDILAVQNQELLSEYSNTWPVSLRDVVQVCDTFCRQPENTDGCGLVAGVVGVDDLMIPAERTSFLTCFHEGTDKINNVQDTNGDVNLLYGGICDDSCTGNIFSNKCGVVERRTACKLLCCSQGDTIAHCLSDNNDTCSWYQ